MKYIFKNRMIVAALIVFVNVKAQNCDVSSFTLGSFSSRNSPCFNYLDAVNTKKYCINVKFHIVRKDDGSGNFDSSKIVRILTKLNSALNPHGINLLYAGYDYIDNSYLALNTSNSVGSLALFTTNYDANALNFYIIIGTSNGNRGFAHYGGSVAVVGAYVEKDVPIHEIGHAFGLFHTFEYQFPVFFAPMAETINGSNCSFAGDLVCDTPSDQNSGISNGFKPDLTNFMSYYINTDHFTAGQGSRMRNFIDCYSPASIQSYKCLVIIGSDNICVNSSTNYSFSTIVGSPNIIWTVSPNLNLLTTSNIASNFVATIQATGSGIGEIVATFLMANI